MAAFFHSKVSQFKLTLYTTEVREAFLTRWKPQFSTETATTLYTRVFL